MKVGVIGSGGREHAICISLKKSKNIDKIYCFPGNAGTSFIAENIEIELNNFEELKRVIEELGIDIIIVGPEKPLVDGIVDFLELNKIKVFGPSKKASQFEGSKTFTKNICKQYGIPTAKFEIILIVSGRAFIVSASILSVKEVKIPSNPELSSINFF